MSRLRAGLLRRLDHVWELGWLNLLGVAMVGFLLWLISFPLMAGVDGARAARAGIEGTVTISGCRQNEWLHGDPWRCWGTFVSPDGAVRIERITYDEWLDEDPRGGTRPAALPARVTGPEATRARPVDEEWQGALIVGIACLVLPVLVLEWWTRPDDAPARPVSPTPTRRRSSARRPAKPPRSWARKHPRRRPRRG